MQHQDGLRSSSPAHALTAMIKNPLDPLQHRARRKISSRARRGRTADPQPGQDVLWYDLAVENLRVTAGQPYFISTSAMRSSTWRRDQKNFVTPARRGPG
jgi:hypothetical protein